VTHVRRVVPALVLGLALSACGKKASDGPVYQAVTVEQRDISVTVQAAGTALPDTVVEVKSKASGEILEFNVETGQLVQRGTLLARIDRRVPQNRYDQAEAQLDVANARLRNAETQLKRSQELFEARAITEQELETTTLDVANAKSAVISAQIELDNAKIALDDTEVRAPITGTIIAKNVERGAVISSPTSDVGGGTVLAKMADLSLVQVKAFVDQTDIGKLKPGLDARVMVEAFPNRPFVGTVLKIEPQADTIQNVTMFPVLIRINNRDGLLRPGMSAEVNLAVGSATDVLAVPNAALRTERDVASAASVLGISDADLKSQLDLASAPANPVAGDTGSGAALPKNSAGPGVPTQDQIKALMAKAASGGTLTQAERVTLQAAGGNAGGSGRRNGRGAGSQDAMFGGRYIVFTMRGGKPTAVYVQTGITDLDWSEVKSGLTAGDTVLLLPSASLIQAQQGLQDRMSRNSGLPGQSR